MVMLLNITDLPSVALCFLVAHQNCQNDTLDL